MKSNKSRERVPFIVVLFSGSVILVLTLLLNVEIYAQINTTSTSLSDENSLIIMVNLERIRNQILLAEKSVASDDKDMAFAHSYIPHSVIFPSIKGQLNAINSQSASQLEALLTDIPISVRSGENAQGLVNISKLNYEKIVGFIDERRRQEINSFFSQLENSIMQRANIEPISQLVSAIERDLAEYLSVSTGYQGAPTTTSEHSQYFTTIRNLLSDVLIEVKENGDYRQADKAAMTAYLDNYEYLEAPIERLNATLMEDIEVDMREELRGMLKEEQPIAAIEN